MSEVATRKEWQDLKKKHGVKKSLSKKINLGKRIEGLEKAYNQYYDPKLLGDKPRRPEKLVRPLSQLLGDIKTYKADATKELKKDNPKFLKEFTEQIENKTVQFSKILQAMANPWEKVRKSVPELRSTLKKLVAAYKKDDRQALELHQMGCVGVLGIIDTQLKLLAEHEDAIMPVLREIKKECSKKCDDMNRLKFSKESVKDFLESLTNFTKALVKSGF